MASTIPARVKFRKMHRGSRAGIAWKGCNVSFGEFGLQALGRNEPIKNPESWII